MLPSYITSPATPAPSEPPLSQNIEMPCHVSAHSCLYENQGRCVLALRLRKFRFTRLSLFCWCVSCVFVIRARADGKNKVQWVQALRAASFTFWVLPRGFVVHKPHAATASNRIWTSSGEHKAEMDALFDEQIRLQRQNTVQPEQCQGTQELCNMPLEQLIDPLEASYAGRRGGRPAEDVIA